MEKIKNKKNTSKSLKPAAKDLLPSLCIFPQFNCPSVTLITCHQMNLETASLKHEHGVGHSGGGVDVWMTHLHILLQEGFSVQEDILVICCKNTSKARCTRFNLLARPKTTHRAYVCVSAPGKRPEIGYLPEKV